MKKSLIFAIALVAAVACTKTEADFTLMPETANTTLAIPLLEESGLMDGDTKAYLEQGDGSWKYVWEANDKLQFFQYRRGVYYSTGQADIQKTPDFIHAIYPAEGFKAGDALFSWLYQEDCDMELSNLGIESNNDPSNFYFCIPTLQQTSCEPEEYYATENLTFSITNINTSGLSTYSISGDAIEGVVPAVKQLKFKIKGYNTEVEYLCSGDAANFSIDAYGNASVNVVFPAFTSSRKSGSNYISTAAITVFADGFEDSGITFNFTATAKPQTFLLWTTGYKVTYTCTNPSVLTSEIIKTIGGFGEVKPYPVRNCMPCVTQQLNITSALLKYPEDIQSATTMYMLGSAAEFRLFSSDNNIAVGETLLGVMFNASAPCAGVGTYDMFSGDLTLRNMTSNLIMSNDVEGKEIMYGSDSYVPLYMVLAPGTYTATVSFFTDQNVYTFNMTSKTFARAVKKAINCDLKKATVQSLSDYLASMGGNEEGEEDEDDM